MTNVTIFNNALDPDQFEVYSDVEDVCFLLHNHFGNTFPSTARIYHNEVAALNEVTPHSHAEIERLQKLTGNIFVVVWPEGPLVIAVIVAIALAAVAIGLAFLLRPHPKGQDEGSPNNELSDRQNKARPNERIPDIFGTVRSTPDLIAVPYKEFISNHEYEICALCIGRSAYDIIDCKDDQTPVDEIGGEFAAIYGPFKCPNQGDAPDTTFGANPLTGVPNIVSIQPSTAVNGQLVRAPNSGRFYAYNNVRFKYGGIIETNGTGVDFTEYFSPSVTGKPSYLQIFTNDDGVNASDPGEHIHSVGLAGIYLILAVTPTQITLSSPELVNANWNVLATFTGEESTFYHSFYITSSGSKIVGPFIINVNDLAEVWGNFVAPNGLYYVNSDGNQHGLTVTIKMSAQAIDATLTPFGDVISASINIVGSSVDRNIVGSTLKMGLPSKGPVMVWAERITPMGTSSKNTYAQDIQWRDLYGVSGVTFHVAPPDDIPEGEQFVWIFPHAATVVLGGGSTIGYTISDRDGGGGIFKLPFGGSLTTESSLTFRDFRATDLPGDAVISRIIACCFIDNLGDSPVANFGIDVTTNGFKTGSPSTLTGLDVSTATIKFSAHETLNGSFPNINTKISNVAIGIYLSSATNLDFNGFETSSGNFGNVTTLVGITAQTPDALSIKERKLNLLVTRKIPTWINRTEPGAPQFSTALIASNNAADILCAMALDPYIGRRAVSELDVSGIYDIADSAYMSGEHEDGEIVTYFGTFLMTEFCYTFDDSKVSFEESAAFLAQAINCIAYRNASTINLSFEKQTANSSMIFNHRNKLPKSEQRTVSFGTPNDYDSITYDYVDPNAPNYPDVDTPQTLYFPVAKTGVSPRNVKSVGVRNIVQATTNGWRLFQKIFFANIQSQFSATQEAALRVINDRVLVADNTRTETIDGDILSQSGLNVVASQKHKMIDGHTYTAFFQHYDDTVESIVVTPGADEFTMVLASAPLLPLVVDSAKFARTTFILVDNATTMRPLPFLIQAKEPQDNNTYKVTAINYTDKYYLRDQDYNTGALLAPVAGYAPQGYTGSGLLKADGTTYTPPARAGFDGGSYSGSDLDGGNNPDTPVTDPPVDSSGSPGLIILVNGE